MAHAVLAPSSAADTTPGTLVMAAAVASRAASRGRWHGAPRAWEPSQSAQSHNRGEWKSGAPGPSVSHDADAHHHLTSPSPGRGLGPPAFTMVTTRRRFDVRRTDGARSREGDAGGSEDAATGDMQSGSDSIRPGTARWTLSRSPSAAPTRRARRTPPAAATRRFPLSPRLLRRVRCQRPLRPGLRMRRACILA